MKPEDFKYEKTQLFVADTDNVEEFMLEQYIDVVATEKPPAEQTATYPVVIKSFPWEPRFEGLSFIVSNVDITEDEEGAGAQLSYVYNVISGGDDLDIVRDDSASRDTPDNELLDVFIGRVIENLLFKMTQDKEFMESVIKSDETTTTE